MSGIAVRRAGKPPRRRREGGMPLDSRSIPLPYADRFEAVAARLPGHELPWLRDLRAEAIERVRQSGLPTIRNERWKYTNLKSLAAVAFTPAGDAAASIAPDRLPSIAGACRWSDEATSCDSSARMGASSSYVALTKTGCS